MREKNFLSRSLMVQSLSSVLPQVVPLFASAFTFIAMTMTGVDLTATQVCSHFKIVPWPSPLYCHRQFLSQICVQSAVDVLCKLEVAVRYVLLFLILCRPHVVEILI